MAKAVWKGVVIAESDDTIGLDLRLLGVIKVPQRVVIGPSRKNKAGRRFRWSRAVAANSGVQRLLWDRSA